MATRKSPINTVNDQQNSATEELAKTEIGFIPLFNSNKPIEKDENGTPIKGLALLIYQGFSISPIIWTDGNGIEQIRNAKKHVFAVKANDLTWKCIDITVGKYNPGNLYDRFLSAMKITDFMDSVTDKDEDGWGKGECFNDDAVTEQLTQLRGLTYTATLERITTKKGVKVYQINVDSLQPLLDTSGTHKRRQAITETDPHAKTIFSQSE